MVNIFFMRRVYYKNVNLTRRKSKAIILENLLKNLVEKGQFDLVVLSDKSGLTISAYNKKNLTTKFFSALSSIIYSSAKRYATDLLMGKLNFILINTEYGEFILLPIDIEDYPKEFILSALISHEEIRNINFKERSAYKEVINLLNKYSLGKIRIKKTMKSTFSPNSSIEQLGKATENVKTIFSN